MARKPKKQKVYYNNDTDTWSNDSGEQPYLMPGSEAYEAYQERLKAQEKAKKEKELELQAEKQLMDELTDKEKYKKVGDVFDVGTRKFRSQQKKASQNKSIEKLVEGGLGHDVKVNKQSSALYDDSLNEAEYKKAVVSEYKKEAEKVREIPTVDTNGDGKIDKDDVQMTPGMKSLMRYM